MSQERQRTIFSLSGSARQFLEALVKSLTCREMGGACDQKISANSWNELVQKLSKHVAENHPEVAKQMEEMHSKDPKMWGAANKPKWEAATEEKARAH